MSLGRARRRTRCCCRRRAPRCAASSTGPPRPPASRCAPRPRSTACACWRRWRSRLRRRRSCRPPPSRAGSKGDFRRITVPELPRRVVGWVRRRRPAPSAADRGGARRAASRSSRRRAPSSRACTSAPTHCPLGRGQDAVASRADGDRCAVDLRARVPGAVACRRRDDRRPARSSWVDVDAGRAQRRAVRRSRRRRSRPPPRTALERADPARRSCIGSSGADIVEGIAALHGWGLAAPALADCSGVVPDRSSIVDGPAVSGPALLLGLADFVVMTERRLRLRQRARRWCAEFTGVDDRQRRARRRRPATPATPARPSLVVPDRDAARRRWSPSCSPTCPTTPTRSRRAGRPTTRPTGRRPEAGELMPAVVDRQLRRARGDRGRSSTTASCSSCGRAGRPTSSPRSPRSTAARSASSPTSRWPSPARSTSRPRRRPPGSSRSATPSTCRSSRSSTRPASTRARTSSGGA